MSRPLRLPLFVCSLLCAAWLLVGCATVDYSVEDPARYGSTMADLERALSHVPDSTEARRALGLLQLRTGLFRDAGRNLQEAVDEGSTDPEALFSLGLALERSGDPAGALSAYQRYPEVPPSSRFREPMEGRYALLIRERVRAQVRQALAAEAERADIAPAREVVAVVPWTYQGSEPRFAPLGTGLAEMIAVDLAQVASLQVVERARLQVLLGELALSATDAVDPASAPRTGRLLGAGRLIAGSYNVLDDDLRLDAALIDLSESSEPVIETQSDALRQLFILQKQLVFALVDRMGITLTAAEREAIGEIPTENLDAFLRFARGLELEQEGRYPEAAQAFEEAAGLDPAFTQAADAEVRARSVGTATGDARTFQRTVMAPATTPSSGMAPVGRRLDALGMGLGSDDVPEDPDERRPATEVSDELPRLPDPPPPPPQN